MLDADYDWIRHLVTLAFDLLGVVAMRDRDAHMSREERTMTTQVLHYSAFTYQGRGGNPAGVVLDARGLTDAEMLQIAEEVGYSETAFLFPKDSSPDLGSDDGAVTTSGIHNAAIRFFSPLAEVAFCGHATVASAAAVADRHGPGEIHFSTQVGPVVIRTWTTGSRTGATLTSPPAGSRPATPDELNSALETFGWTAQDLDPQFPTHVGFAGNHHLMLGVRSRDTLAGMTYDYPALARLMASESWTTVNVFWAESDVVFHARNPFPPGGVVEDPATGAAAAAFGGYLRQIGHIRPPATLTIYQGHDLGTPSELTVELNLDQDGIAVSGEATELPSEGTAGTVS